MQIRQVALTLAARIIAMAGPFGVSVVTARGLGPEDRGAYFLIVSYAQVAAQFANLGLQSSNTYMAANRPHLAGPLLLNGTVVALGLAPPVAMVIAVAFGWPEAIGRTGETSLGPIALLAAVQAPLLVVFLYITNLAVTVQRVALFNGLTITMGCLALASAALVWAAQGGLDAYLWAAIAALGFSTVLGAVLLLRGQGVRFRFDFALVREGVGYALRAYLAALSSFLLMRVGALVLQLRADLETVGQFSIAQQIGDALILLPATVALLLFPGLMRISDMHARWRTCGRALIGLGAVMGGLAAVIALIAPWAVPFVFGAAYAPATDLVLALLPTVFLMALITVISQYLAADGFPWSKVVTWLIATPVHAVLSLWLVEPYGAMGIFISLGVVTFGMLVVLGLIAWSRRPRGAAPNGQGYSG